MSAESPSPEARPCQNCGKPLLGNHCYACGQPVKGLVRHFSSIAGDFLDSVFDFDSRVLRTLGPLLTRPGYLSNEYFAGRRVRYVSPVRLFVFLCVISFFVVQLAIDDEMISGDGNGIQNAENVAEVERMRANATEALRRAHDDVQDGAARQRLERQIAQVDADAERRIDWLAQRDAALARGEKAPVMRVQRGASLQFDSEPWHPVDNPLHFDALPDAANDWLNVQIGRADENLQRVQNEPRLLVETFLQTLPQTFFVLLPLFALLLKFAYLFKRRLYMEHLIVALHSHAFLCLAVLLLVGADAARDQFDGGVVHAALGWFERGLALWMPLYLLLMQKRVYRQGWIMTSLKFVLIGIAYSVLLSLGMVANMLLNLVTM